MSACPSSQHVIRANLPFPSLGPPRRATCGIRFSAGYRHTKRHAPAGALPFGPGRRTGGAGRIPATLLSPGNLRPSIESFATPHISGSYRLRRHFPRHCDVSTRIPYPYQLRFLRPEGPRDRLRAPCPRPAQAANPRNAELVVRRSQKAGHAPSLRKLLPAGLRNARDQTLRGHLAELDTADAEQADVAFGTPRDLATVVLADGIRVARQFLQGDPGLLVVHLTALYLCGDPLALVSVTLCELLTLHFALLH